MIEFKYRPEVDGLRAVSVVLVLLFHADLGFSGGFVGVDVFFVISGFLITGLILKEMKADTFRLSKFWVRRIRRIIPASSLVVAITLLVGIVFLLPSDLQELAESAVSQQLMLSNVFFWRHTGYFEGSAHLKPLLHTWSLAVEEQFYLGYPFLLVLMRRFSDRRRLSAILLLCVLSYAVSEYGMQSNPRATFFLLPTRAWELLMGALLCYAPFPKALKAWQATLCSWTGIAMIVGAGWFFDATTPFPGRAALVPCAGAALVIFSNSGNLTAVGRMLTLRPAVFVGLLSYSLYLWHWPIFAFLRYWHGSELSVLVRSVALAASLAFAYLSWRFVEKPFRVATIQTNPWRPCVAAASSAGALILVGTIIVMTDGAKFRFAKEVLVFDQPARADFWKYGTSTDSAKKGEFPIIGAVEPLSGKTEFAIWGDSHAMATGSLWDSLGKKHGIRGVLMAKSATGPLLNAPGQSENEWNQAAVDFIESSKIPNVVLVARWSMHFDPVRNEVGRANTVGLKNTIAALRNQGIDIWLMKQVPQQQCDPKKVLFLGAFLGRGLAPGVARGEHHSVLSYFEPILNSLPKAGLTIIDPTSNCFDARGNSRIGDHGGTFYFDDDHLSVYGSKRLLSDLFDPVFAKFDDKRDTGEGDEVSP